MLRRFATATACLALLGTPLAAQSPEEVAQAALAAARGGACGGVVLVSWEHCRIPSLRMALGCASDVCTRCWPDGVYDTFASNDCTGTVDYVVVVPVGLCCRGGQCESRAIVHDCLVLDQDCRLLE